MMPVIWHLVPQTSFALQATSTEVARRGLLRAVGIVLICSCGARGEGRRKLPCPQHLCRRFRPKQRSRRTSDRPQTDKCSGRFPLPAGNTRTPRALGQGPPAEAERTTAAQNRRLHPGQRRQQRKRATHFRKGRAQTRRPRKELRSCASLARRSCTIWATSLAG